MKYVTETTQILGRMLDHDDSVNDRAEGTKLSNSSVVTNTLWKDAFGEDFSQPGEAMGISAGVRIKPIFWQDACTEDHRQMEDCYL